jgi:tetratricopeptide (TPR) repeat protein
LSGHPRPGPDERRRIRGGIFAFKGDFDRAIAHDSTWIEIEPKNARAYLARGKAYLAKQTYDRAIDDFTKEIENDPDNADAYRARNLA